MLKYRAQKSFPANVLPPEACGIDINSTQGYSLIEKKGKGQHCEIWNGKIIIRQVPPDRRIDPFYGFHNAESANMKR
jgi:hypothetical protein